MAHEFSVTFAGDYGQEPRHFPGTVHFRILENGVLVITDGDDVRRFSPHAWREVRGGGSGDSAGGDPASIISF
jgi:hypothetical protein